jgi:hypothetical protein
VRGAAARARAVVGGELARALLKGNPNRRASRGRSSRRRQDFKTATGEVALVEGGEEMEPLGSSPAVAPSSVPMEDGASEQLGPLSVRC